MPAAGDDFSIFQPHDPAGSVEVLEPAGIKTIRDPQVLADLPSIR